MKCANKCGHINLMKKMRRARSRSNARGAVVWCYLNSRGKTALFGSTISNRIEVYYSQENAPNLNSNSHFLLGDPKRSPKWADYEIKLQSLTMENRTTGELHQICRHVCEPESVFSRGYEWLVQGDLPKEWLSYDFYSSQLIEDAVSNRNQRSLLLDLSTTDVALPYIIDLRGKSYFQTNIHTRRKRKVERQRMPIPYISVPVSSPSSTGKPTNRASMQTDSQLCGTVAPVAAKKLQLASGAASLQKSSSHPRSTSGGTDQEPVTESLPCERCITITREQKATDQKNALNIEKYMAPVTDTSEMEADCTICMQTLSEDSGFGEGSDQAKVVVKLTNCEHAFHRLCLLAMFESSHKEDCLECPTCKTIYGVKQGNCPPGDMRWEIRRTYKIPGYERYHVIRIIYSISPGIQGPGDPNPGSRYRANGFPREGFLPDCNKGRKVLKLLIEAFKRKLMFTIGTSVTTGVTDTVVWNEIHLKTEPTSNYSGHGYPDPQYLDNVLMELACQGVGEESGHATI